MKILLRDVVEDWHLFGLVAPEADLLEAMDEQLKERLSVGDIDPKRVLRDENRSLWQALLALKRDWPFRAANRPWANYFFNDGLYEKPPVNYEKTGQTFSRYDRLFRELHSVFENPEALVRAEAFLDRLFDGLAGTL